ncbi:hypothetical protein K1719_047012 [Acacia pycnantha]|nr:hypothetical protein K1719_047012 [Acacia pycnantha]
MICNIGINPSVASLLGAAEENHKENSNRLYIHPPSQSDDDDKHQRLIDEVIPLFMKCGLPETCLDPQTKLQFGCTTSILAKLLHRLRPLDSAVKREYNVPC